ncbi:hypothetical protein ACLI09_14050 [Flavobacterium sp. RHBU_24]|uniref:hypothetical protein n=1 Tax=Flavobacterium sp. RHBU_24 TaxID=3391185 RepID=UPI003984FE76
MFSLVSAMPEFYAKRSVQWHLALFFLGVAFCFVLPMAENPMAYYFVALTLLTALFNLILIVLLFIRRPKLYLLYCLFLILFPVILGYFSMMVILITSGFSC